MSDNPSLSDLTREQLYQLVWATPATKLSEQLGVSDVAIAKRCRKLGVPRPERGYWAQLEFGKKAHRPELPPLPPSPAEVFAEEAKKPIAASVTLPADDEPLHPLAAAFLAAVKEAKLGYDKQRVHLQTPELPAAEISKAQAPRAAAVLHALLNILEPRGILFKKARSKYDGGCFRKGNDDLHPKIEEELVDKPEPSRRQRNYSSWQQPDNKVACGRLTFKVKHGRYSGEEKRWSENEKTPLETIVTAMAKDICRHYADLQKQREEEAIRREKERIEWEIQRKKNEEEEAIRRQAEATRKHAGALEKAARTRQEDLLKASGWWRLYRDAEDYIAECERRWRSAQTGVLSAEQEAWVHWARETAKSVCPFDSGYPDPVRDGSFDPKTVVIGGSYPPTRNFPTPPTMPEIPAPVVVQQGYGTPDYQPSPKPYPFWLKYQRR